MDDNFMFSRDRIVEFCKLVKPLNIAWCCQTRADSIDDEIVKLMKDSGCIFIRLGLESGSERMLKIMQKGHTLEHSKKAIESMVKANMGIKIGFMFGMPFETIGDAKETIKFSKEIYKQCKTAILSFYYYTPRPATPWTEMAFKKFNNEFTLKEWSKVDKYLTNPLNLSKMSDRQIRYFVKKTRYMSLFYRKGLLKKVIISKLKIVKEKIVEVMMKEISIMSKRKIGELAKKLKPKQRL